MNSVFSFGRGVQYWRIDGYISMDERIDRLEVLLIVEEDAMVVKETMQFLFIVV